MIYESVGVLAPICQGDIFVDLPRIDVSLRQMIIAGDMQEYESTWEQIAGKGEPLRIIVPVRPVAAIVATQDCDAQHNRDITLCEIRGFSQVTGLEKQSAPSLKAWKILTQQARLNLKWFYLPPGEEIGFNEKKAVDFQVTLRVSREELETLRHLRKGRLNAMADEHFRERISEFFRRYPYDEWYPLNQEEFAKYKEHYPEAKPFPWQQPQSPEGQKGSEVPPKAGNLP
ncbi:MAG TPA: hypothetical protein VM141_09160 [Planctomycetota bacterium]|nr:hypothetical protein [Planctomycetota bacterium]